VTLSLITDRHLFHISTWLFVIANTFNLLSFKLLCEFNKAVRLSRLMGLFDLAKIIDLLFIKKLFSY